MAVDRLIAVDRNIKKKKNITISHQRDVIYVVGAHELY